MRQYSQLGLQIAQLSKLANVCGLPSRDSISVEVRSLIFSADVAKRPLNREELKQVCSCCKSSESAVSVLMNASISLVDRARHHLVQDQPHLFCPGGQLYPEYRAQACWRDCEQFLRVIIYGLACACPDITDKAGMRALLNLYQLLDVPVSALLHVLSVMRTLAMQHLNMDGYGKESLLLSLAFDDLIRALQPIDVESELQTGQAQAL